VVSCSKWIAPCLLGLVATGCSLLGYESPGGGDAGERDARSPSSEDAGEDDDARVEPDGAQDAAADAEVELDADGIDGAVADAQSDANQLDASDAQASTDAAADAEALDASDANITDASDASSDASLLDGALPPPTPTDAGNDTSEAGVPWDAGAGTCSGVRALNLCWYLATAATSCNEFCAAHGGFDPRTSASVGTAAQGGRAANCRAVFSALGLTGTFQVGTRSDGRGFGCHQWQTGLWWLSSPAFGPTVSSASARVACACAK
jgi:hypothetical protein